ncbi:MAG TPA: hypothetical protein VGH19_21560 [Verrucomicrobiae bacterium]
MPHDNIKIQYAIRDGRLVEVKDVERGLDCNCVCAGCGGSLIARKGEHRIHHFSHANIGTPCSEESVLHILSKRILRERIERSLLAHTALEIEWNCSICEGKHKVDLLKKAIAIKEEYCHGSIRADLMLFNRKGLPYIAIEMVVTHSPEPETIEFYRNSKIVLAEFDISSSSDLELLEKAAILQAAQLNYCLAVKCSCGGLMDARSVYVVDRNCSRCKRIMKAAYGLFQWGLAGPEEFRSAEIQFAQEKGVKIERRFSKTASDYYMVNVCPRCDAFWGRHFLSDVWNNFVTDPSTVVLLQCRKCSRTEKCLKDS